MDNYISIYGTDRETMRKFEQDKYSIQFAYKIGVFSYEYAMRRFAYLYARTFGVCSGIYREMSLCDFAPCFEN